MDIKNQLVLVTGGASGLGAASCEYLAELGAELIIMDKNENAALQVAHKIHGYALGCDITSEIQVQQSFENIKKKFKKMPTVLINCAGIAPAQKLVGKEGPVSLSWVNEVININLLGPFNVMKQAAAAMMNHAPNSEGERGVIINTGSIAATDGQIGQTAYSASKGAIAALTLPAARELAPFGIRVMTIAPGLMATPLVQNFSEKIRTSLKQQLLFPKRFGAPQEYAKLVAHIIENPLLNGAIIRLDGGLRMNSN